MFTQKSPETELFLRSLHKAIGGQDAPISFARSRGLLRFWERTTAKKTPLNGESIERSFLFEYMTLLRYLARDMQSVLGSDDIAIKNLMKPKWIAAWKSIWVVETFALMKLYENSSFLRV